MTGRMITLALFPFYCSMRVLGVVVHDLLQLRDDLRGGTERRA